MNEDIAPPSFGWMTAQTPRRLEPFRRAGRHHDFLTP
jgi:hypothetical protein